MIGLHGGGHPATQRLMDGEWRNATFAEFVKFPFEDVFALEGGAAVTVALAMGAKVIRCWEEPAALDALGTVFAKMGRNKTGNLSGDAAKDTEELKIAAGNQKSADAYIDFSPSHHRE
ncbi:hypothetical protein MMC29_007928 [Sticta canariensis]|nr:hypothetical protein [Sticta canariensis]